MTGLILSLSKMSFLLWSHLV